MLPLIQRLPDCSQKHSILTSAVKGLPLSEAITAIGAGSDFATTSAKRIIFRSAASKSVEEVIAFHAEATGPDRYAAADGVGAALITKDPAAAVAWAQENLSGFARTNTIQKAAGNLESKDPAAAEAARALLPESYKHQ